MKKFITPLLFLFLLSGFALLRTSAFGQNIIYSEDFDYPAGQLPTDWTLEGAQVQWSVSNSSMAGGEAAELYLGYSFAFGTSRLISTPINVEGDQKLLFKYKQYLVNYEADFGEIIGLDVTFDGGQTWEALWENPLGLLNIPQNEFTYYFNTPSSATEMQFAFRFEGNNYAINLWAIDDIVLETVPDNDLLCTSVMGNTTPKAGEENLFIAVVQNGGALTQTGYTVRLMTEGGVELASVSGDQIVFNEKKYCMLFWTPGDEYIGNVTNIYTEVVFAQDENTGNNQSDDMIINVQTDNTATTQISSGSWPLLYLPYNFLQLYSLSQTLYFPDEIGFTDSPITAIQYTCQFDQEVSVPVQIFMGETDVNDLSEGWVAPATLTKVFDGTLDFPKGQSNFHIALDDAYEYHGGNLVVYSVKSYSEMVIGTPFISAIDTSSMRSRSAERDDAPFDPMDPPSNSSTWDYYPNITFFYSVNNVSVNDNTKEPASLNMYPVPANDMLYVKAGETIIEIKITDIIGQVVYYSTGRSEQHEVSVGNLNPGIYMVQVLTSKGITTQKVQIAR